MTMPKIRKSKTPDAHLRTLSSPNINLERSAYYIACLSRVTPLELQETRKWALVVETIKELINDFFPELMSIVESEQLIFKIEKSNKSHAYFRHYTNDGYGREQILAVSRETFIASTVEMLVPTLLHEVIHFGLYNLKINSKDKGHMDGKHCFEHTIATFGCPSNTSQFNYTLTQELGLQYDEQSRVKRMAVYSQENYQQLNNYMKSLAKFGLRKELLAQ